jgi:hypothetical protein
MQPTDQATCVSLRFDSRVGLEILSANCPGDGGKPIVKKATPSGSKYRVPAAPTTRPEIPSSKRLAGPMPSKCELVHNRAHSFQNGAGSDPRLLLEAAS